MSRVPATWSRDTLVLSIGDMIPLHWPSTAREAVPANCTARCARSMYCSHGCAPHCTALAPPPAWLLRFHARATHFWRLNRATSRNLSSRKVRMLRKHSQTRKQKDASSKIQNPRLTESRFSSWYFRPRDSEEMHNGCPAVRLQSRGDEGNNGRSRFDANISASGRVNA